MPTETVSHTPGPWVQAPNDPLFIYALHSHNGSIVNRMSLQVQPYPNQGGSREEGVATARLIAAAPRMFDALKGLVGLIQLLPDAQQCASLQRNHRYIEALEALATASESEHA